MLGINCWCWCALCHLWWYWFSFYVCVRGKRWRWIGFAQLRQTQSNHRRWDQIHGITFTHSLFLLFSQSFFLRVWCWLTFSSISRGVSLFLYTDVHCTACVIGGDVVERCDGRDWSHRQGWSRCTMTTHLLFRLIFLFFLLYLFFIVFFRSRSLILYCLWKFWIMHWCWCWRRCRVICCWVVLCYVVWWKQELMCALQRLALRTAAERSTLMLFNAGAFGPPSAADR